MAKLNSKNEKKPLLAKNKSFIVSYCTFCWMYLQSLVNPLYLAQYNF